MELNDGRCKLVVPIRPYDDVFPNGACGEDAIEARALALVRARVFEWEQISVPKPPSEWALIETLAVGVCGTDLGLVDGRHSRGPSRLILGHEWCGRVITVGSKGYAHLLGRRVVGENVLPGSSPPAEVGFELPGGFASHFLALAEQLHLLPDHVDAVDGVMAEPLAVVSHLIDRLRPTAASRALIFGDGPIGLLTARLLRVDHHAEVTVVGRDADRLRIAQAEADAAVAEWPFPRDDGDSWDVVIEASGDPLAAQLGAQHCRDGGVVALAGAYPADGSISLSHLTQHNLRVEGVNAGHGAWAAALKSLENGTISSRLLHPAIVEIDDAPTVIMEMLDPTNRPLKLILTYPSGSDTITDSDPVGEVGGEPVGTNYGGNK